VVSSRLAQLHRTAFVTGASTGLGRAFVEMLLASGVRVWGTSRRTDRLAELQAQHPTEFTGLALDLRDGAGAVAAFMTADAEAGGFDLVINNAGYGVFGEFAAVDFSVWEEQLQVMLINTARLTHAALQAMRPRGRGTLVNVSSLAVEFPLPFQSAYNMAKAGLTALSESLMTETSGSGIVVIDFRPGDYRTDFEGSVLRPQAAAPARVQRAWDTFGALMRSGPNPAGAATALHRALLENRSGTVRTGRFFQAVFAPFLSRFGSLQLRRRIQARYFHV
jgi:short-subunit dehydrogenase